jgi:hypothetical protein
MNKKGAAPNESSGCPHACGNIRILSKRTCLPFGGPTGFTQMVYAVAALGAVNLLVGQ